MTAIVAVIISEQQWFKKLTIKINNKTFNNNIWEDIIDYKNGTTLKITCKDKTYIGIFVAHEEKNSVFWIVLKDYIIVDGERTLKANEYEDPCLLVVNSKDVNSIELFYSKKNNLIF